MRRSPHPGVSKGVRREAGALQGALAFLVVVGRTRGVASDLLWRGSPEGVAATA